MDNKIFKPSNKITIHNADCLDFLKSLPAESVDIIVTDPAYSGMNNKMNFGNGRIVGKYQNKDNDKWFQEFKDDPETFLHFLKECNRVLKSDRHIYIMFDSFSLLTLGHLMRGVFNVKNIIVWDKVNMGMGHYFRRRHEFIMFATKGYRKLNSRDIPDVWKVKRILRGKYPTQKPVDIFELMLKGSAESDFTVCDPFLGSGSAAIAALRKNCKFIGADVSKKACQIANERIEHFIKTKVDPYQKEPAFIPNGNGDNHVSQKFLF
jgi:site-specific DNA-methyltransferase (adenine-specific)